MRALLAAYALFSVGAGVMLFYLPLHLFSLGGSLFDVALITTIPALVSMVFSGVWGKLSDELKTRKLFIIIGMAAMSAFFLSMLVLKTKSSLLMSLAGFTVLTCATEPAIQAYVTSLLPKARGAAAGKVNAYNYAGIAAAALFGGFIYDWFGFGTVTLLAAVAGMAGVALMIGVREDAKRTFQTRRAETTRRGLGGVLFGGLLALYVFMFIFMVGGSAFGPMASVYLVQLGNSRTVYGIFTFLSFIVGGLVSTRVGGLVDKYGSGNVLLLAALAYIAQFMAVYSVKAPLPALIAWSFPIYLLGWIAAMAAVAEGTSSGNRGTGMGLLTSSKNFGMVAGSLAGGVIAGASGGVGTVLLFSTLTSALAAMIVVFRFRRRF